MVNTPVESSDNKEINDKNAGSRIKKSVSSLHTLLKSKCLNAFEFTKEVFSYVNQSNRLQYIPLVFTLLMIPQTLSSQCSRRLLEVGGTYKPFVTQFTDVKTGFDDNGQGGEINLNYHQGRVRTGITGGYLYTEQDDGKSSYIADNHYLQLNLDLIGNSDWAIAPYIGAGVGLHRSKIDFTEYGKTKYSEIYAYYGNVRYGLKVQLADLIDSDFINGFYIQVGSSSDFPLTNKDTRLDGNTPVDPPNNTNIIRGQDVDKRNEGFRPINPEFSIGVIKIFD